MIAYKSGSVLESDCDVIVHQVNCMGAMGKGLAGAIRSTYPSVYTEYSSLCKNMEYSIDLLGKVQFIYTGNHIIANLFGQYNYGNYGKYTKEKALEQGLTEVKEYCETEYKSLAIPYGIGCNLGGASWDNVLPIIESIFKHSNVEVYIYKYK